MSGRKLGDLFALVAIGSAVAYSANFVGEQIAFLHEKLSPPAIQLKLAPDWPGAEPNLPTLNDLPKANFKTDLLQSK